MEAAVKMHLLRLLLVLEIVTVGSAMEKPLAPEQIEGQLRRVSDTGRMKAQGNGSNHLFPRKSVGFFLEKRAQKQQRKGENSTSQPANPAMIESILKRLRGAVSDETSGTEQPDESEQPNES